MECPFCAETVKDEAIACKHCSRDLRVVRPVILEIGEIVSDLDRLRRELDEANVRLERISFPVRYFVRLMIEYVFVPIVLLVAAHVIVTIMLNVTPLYLRLASVVIPLPFGLLLYANQKIRFGSSVLVGILTAVLAVTCMLVITGVNDNVPIAPGPWVEWREVVEYTASITLAYLTGNILAFLIFDVLPTTMAQGDRPNPAAYRMAGLLGQHVGEEQLRRRARTLQHLLRTAGPLAGMAITAGGSVYAGMKGIFGW